MRSTTRGGAPHTPTSTTFTSTRVSWWSYCHDTHTTEEARETDQARQDPGAQGEGVLRGRRWVGPRFVGWCRRLVLSDRRADGGGRHPRRTAHRQGSTAARRGAPLGRGGRRGDLGGPTSHRRGVATLQGREEPQRVAGRRATL